MLALYSTHKRRLNALFSLFCVLCPYILEHGCWLGISMGSPAIWWGIERSATWFWVRKSLRAESRRSKAKKWISLVTLYREIVVTTYNGAPQGCENIIIAWAYVITSFQNRAWPAPQGIWRKLSSASTCFNKICQAFSIKLAVYCVFAERRWVAVCWNMPSFSPG